MCQRRLSARRSLAAAPHVANTGVGRAMSLASFLRFWAVAANRNSSLALAGALDDTPVTRGDSGLDQIAAQPRRRDKTRSSSAPASRL